LSSGVENRLNANVSKVRVLTEKPMTTDIDKCRRILETVKKTGRHVTVTFNYRYGSSYFSTLFLTTSIIRYNPIHELVKRTIAEGKIGKGEFVVIT
jgi:predicted dehydrogenase